MKIKLNELMLNKFENHNLIEKHKKEMVTLLLNEGGYVSIHRKFSQNEDEYGNYDYRYLSNVEMIYVYIHMRGKNRKEKSKKEYVRELLQFLYVIKEYEVEDIRKLSRRNIEGYQNHIEKMYDKSSTITKKLNIVKSFLKWCYQERYTKKDLTRGFYPVRIDKTEVVERDISIEQMRQAIQYYENNPKVKSIIMLLATSGLRLAEIITPSWSDLYYDSKRKKYYLKTVTKRDKVRHALIKDYVLEEIKEYRGRVGLDIELNSDDESPFYPNRYGKRYSLSSLSTTLSKQLAHSGLTTVQGERVTPHFLRHFFARTAYSNGAPLDHIADTLDHSDPRITKQNYLYRELKKEHDVSEFVDLEI
ncbi:tyrosine-type recombinase/integrase [Chengkuizengella axinellae]|uniref:Tyrosine-type recombinase/integrase n=1 Tax=Chengkuizengella axinellae TaxID=3064388 RepID=A0ABT9IW27_9BACL|nr:tyrosine-type recombinase/integrase [Chengkuizengella sp. 2205SS18-9]MDP5273565.1 tyrosine-type recombinase/integrase [Chengkuizengella sp. 2205SS18-9]